RDPASTPLRRAVSGASGRRPAADLDTKWLGQARRYSRSEPRRCGDRCGVAGGCPVVEGGARRGLAALARRRGMSLVQATALSLGLVALLLLAIVAPALLEGWRRELPVDTPNWFVLNLQDDQRASFEQTLTSIGGQKLNMLPLAVGKLTKINGKPIDDLHFQDERAKEWADRQLRLSWSSELPPSNQVIAGQWSGANPAQAEVSIDTSWRDMFHLKVGDTMSFNIGEGDIDAKVGSI